MVEKISGVYEIVNILTWDKVKEIRQRFLLGNITKSELAVEYSVSRACIYKVIYNKTWKYPPQEVL